MNEFAITDPAKYRAKLKRVAANDKRGFTTMCRATLSYAESLEQQDVLVVEDLSALAQRCAAERAALQVAMLRSISSLTRLLGDEIPASIKFFDKEKPGRGSWVATPTKILRRTAFSSKLDRPRVKLLDVTPRGLQELYMLAPIKDDAGVNPNCSFKFTGYPYNRPVTISTSFSGDLSMSHPGIDLSLPVIQGAVAGYQTHSNYIKVRVTKRAVETEDEKLVAELTRFNHLSSARAALAKTSTKLCGVAARMANEIQPGLLDLSQVNKPTLAAMVKNQCVEITDTLAVYVGAPLMRPARMDRIEHMFPGGLPSERYALIFPMTVHKNALDMPSCMC